ncbi:MAG TPA: cytochrome ubiquinol oxidase subunit I [Bellilinea sp.]|nr:cytochrome ubiquinol oxidase subunit I [Bellilinea sp.]
MDPTTGILSQWQFAITSIYHFFFVPLTLGMGTLVAIMETIYVRTGQEMYKRMTKFWGTLFTINFVMGVVTGLVQEFQFGMNWAEYSRFVGDIFGAPLAIEALLAFFLESTFLGLWIFGWDKLSKGIHLAAIWLVSIGSILSAYWILVANSFMQSPVGFVESGGRMVLYDFGALLANPYVWGQFPHTVFSGFTTGAFFVIGISAYHILRRHQSDLFKRSFQIATVFGMISVFLVVLVGHNQAQRMVQLQPMKIAAAEGLLETENPASMSLLTIVDQDTMETKVSVRVPRLLSLLAYNRLDGEVKGVVELQAESEKLYGPGNYIPSIFSTYWTFRIMVGVGMLMLLIAAYALYLTMRNQLTARSWLLGIFPFTLFLPYLANSSGWILTEMGRQPWVVYGYMRTVDAVSKNLTPGMIITSLVGFTLVYGLLMGADIYLLSKYARAGAEPAGVKRTVEEESYWE